MNIEVDSNSGFCFGVVEAVRKAEETLQQQEQLYCLGDIVHNDEEVKRLALKGLVTISYEQYYTMKGVTVLLRAHGEPPSTYAYALQNNIRLIDATCPVVLKLQQRIRKVYELDEYKNTQIVIFGKKGHAEVEGLVGQTDGKAIVIENPSRIEGIDFGLPIELYAQTTKDLEGFNQLATILKEKGADVQLKVHDTVCRQVSNRIPAIRKFSARFELVIFVSGLKSSNGKMLYEICKSVNPNTKFISSIKEIDRQWFNDIGSTGICGATSTPRNLLNDVADAIRQLII